MARCVLSDLQPAESSVGEGDRHLQISRVSERGLFDRQYVHKPFVWSEQVDENVNEVDPEFPEEVLAPPFVPQPGRVGEDDRAVMRDVDLHWRADGPLFNGLLETHDEIPVAVVEDRSKLQSARPRQPCQFLGLLWPGRG